jgi:hypothetical protein
MLRWAGHVACMAAMKDAYNVSVGKKSDYLEDLDVDWEDTSEIDFKWTRWEDEVGIHQAQVRD